MRVLLVLEHVRGEQQSRGERRLPADGNVHQRALGELHRIGGGQDERGAVLLEDDQTDSVATLVGIR